MNAKVVDARRDGANVIELPSRADYFTIDGELVLVPPGLYSLRYMHYETGYLHGRAPKVIVWLSICDPGPAFGKAVARYYNVRACGARRRKGGTFRVGWKSRLVREYGLVEGLPSRTDRTYLDALGRHLLEGRIETVSHDSNRKPIPPSAQYSVCTEITGVRERGC
jgi:hypothetical protein